MSDNFLQPDSSEGSAPGSEELHLWILDHGEFDKDLSELRNWLIQDEVKRAERFSTDELQTSFVLSRSFLRGLLARYLRCHPKEVSFTFGAFGKPALAATSNHSNLNFNLAHSGAMTLCAVVLNKHVGVDVEQTRVVEDMDKIARRFFAPAEVSKFDALPDCDKQEAFFRCWTAKEAFIKATGEGLSRPLDSFTVSFLANEEAKISAINEDRRWHLSYLNPGDGYRAAIVTDEMVNLSTFRWKF